MKWTRCFLLVFWLDASWKWMHFASARAPFRKCDDSLEADKTQTKNTHISRTQAIFSPLLSLSRRKIKEITIILHTYSQPFQCHSICTFGRIFSLFPLCVFDLTFVWSTRKHFIASYCLISFLTIIAFKRAI